MSPWENRERGGRYYTRSRRVNGRVVREYVGTGEAAELEALTNALKRLRQAEEAAAWREEQERLNALEAPVRELCRSAELLARAALIAAGYRQHKRGEWRMRRVEGNEPAPRTPDVPGTSDPDEAGEIERLKAGRERLMDRGDKLRELAELVPVAKEGDESAVPRLREILHELPELASSIVEPADWLEHQTVKNYAGGNLAVREALPWVLAEMRVELRGDDPSPLEKLLVERVVATWLQLHYFEGLYAQSVGDLTAKQSEHQQKRIDRAERRHLAAVKTLTLVRDKLGPRVQVNIAGQQIVTEGDVRGGG